jgi:hypothetical protein
LISNHESTLSSTPSISLSWTSSAQGQQGFVQQPGYGQANYNTANTSTNTNTIPNANASASQSQPDYFRFRPVTGAHTDSIRGDSTSVGDGNITNNNDTNYNDKSDAASFQSGVSGNVQVSFNLFKLPILIVLFLYSFSS